MGNFQLAYSTRYWRSAVIATAAVTIHFWTALPVLAQAAAGLEASPAAPGDLSRPAFDTTTSHYDVADASEKSATIVVAEVDGRTITLGDVGVAVRDLPGSLSSLPFETLFPIVLGQLVKQQALVIRAQHQGLDEVPATRRLVKAAADRALANAMLRTEAEAGITEATLLDRYKTDYAGKPGPTEVHARVITVPTDSQAAELIAELKAGADFAAVARRVSKDATAPSGGNLGFLRLEQLNPEIGSVAFALPPGQFSAYPVRSGGEWFIVKVEERRQTQQPGFPFVRDQIRQAVLRDAAPRVTREALSGVVVREYNVGGKAADEAKPSGN